MQITSATQVSIHNGRSEFFRGPWLDAQYELIDAGVELEDSLADDIEAGLSTNGYVDIDGGIVVELLPA